MAKNLVVNSNESGSVPFLRGILTRSLQAAGLPFEASYRVATAVRDELRDVGEINSDDLRARVVAHLSEFDPAVIERYRNPPPATPTILVQYGDGHGTPYSRGRHRMELECSGLSADQSTRTASEIQDRLAAEGITTIASHDLGRRTYEYLDHEFGAEAARHYLVWEEFKHTRRPLIVLIGGASGTGKSTVATRLAHLLDIVRIQSTDMLREVMRTMVPDRLVPALHCSSYEAWRALSVQPQTEANEAHMLEGYLTQADLVSVATLATLGRALRERVSIIIEGVHINPVVVEKTPATHDAIVVPIMLAVLKPNELKRRLHGRGKRAPDRRAQRHLDNFDALWKIQSFLLSEADRTQIAIVPNEEIDNTMQHVMSVVTRELEVKFTGTPGAVFAGS